MIAAAVQRAELINDVEPPGELTENFVHHRSDGAQRMIFAERASPVSKQLNI